MLEIKTGTHQFYVGDSPENNLAHIEYMMNGYILTILHIDVSDQLQGQGVGQQLVRYVVDFAREKQLQIKPFCSYAHNQFLKHPEYSDVLYPE
jgi:uncharacterized protein